MTSQLSPEYLRPRLLHRENDSHKGDYGHLLVVAGCETMPGAAVLATGAALKSGCGLVSQLVLLPALTCGLAILMTGWISPMMAMGMILVAACPGGNISNFMSSLGKANIELSVSLTAISTALAVFMTPFNFWCWGSIYMHFAGVHGDIPTLVIPLWDVFKTIFILLGYHRHPALPHVPQSGV